MKLTMQLSEHPAASEIMMPVATMDGAVYSLTYRVEQRGAEWWAVLKQMDEIMPPATPQISGKVGEFQRPPMRTAGEEREQRQKEWKQLNEDQNRRVIITGN